MNKLKTLKDFYDGRKGYCFRKSTSMTTSENMVTQDVLKEEAITWIKKYEEEIEEHAYQCGDCSCEFHHNDLSCQSIREKIEWIKHFFNITDEDLNEKE